LPSSPTELLVNLVGHCPTDALRAIADGLETDRITLESSPVGIASLGVDEDIARHCYDTFQSLAGQLDRDTTVIGLRVAADVRTREQLDRPQVEVCWTGPDAEGPLVTPMAAAVDRLLRDCIEIGEILLVGYSFRVPKGSFMEQVVERLVDASKRKAKIQVVLHQDDDSHNTNQLLDAWDVFARKPLVYTWKPSPEHPYTKLHAKCLVVDRLQMLVTSANFTFHGLESNLELGLLVRNQPLASAVHERFDHLIRTGVLHRWEDTP
jgi:phosphatidylserine/phosphatidylglycerophosphate/cardiolipin synthase-like enzyme